MRTVEKIGMAIAIGLMVAAAFYLFRHLALFFLPIFAILIYLFTRKSSWGSRFGDDDPADWWKKGKRPR